MMASGVRFGRDDSDPTPHAKVPPGQVFGKRSPWATSQTGWLPAWPHPRLGHDDSQVGCFLTEVTRGRIGNVAIRA